MGCGRDDQRHHAEHVEDVEIAQDLRLDVPHLLQKFEETRGAKVDDDALLLG